MLNETEGISPTLFLLASLGVVLLLLDYLSSFRGALRGRGAEGRKLGLVLISTSERMLIQGRLRNC